MSNCHYCWMRALRAHAKQTGFVIRTKRVQNGFEIYRIPRIRESETTWVKPSLRKEYMICLIMGLEELPKECECNEPCSSGSSKTKQTKGTCTPRCH